MNKQILDCEQSVKLLRAFGHVLGQLKEDKWNSGHKRKKAMQPL